LADLWPEDESPGRPDALPPPVSATGQPTRGAALPDAGHLSRLLAALPRFPEPGTLPHSASNAWAVSGARSASGAPLLASDPHLGFQAPILWYLARIDLPGGRMLAGATSPGVPLVVIGRNERVAWGFTTTHSDTQDIFLERLVGEAASETPDGPRPFAVRGEAIRVRGRAEPVRHRVRETRHGPVLSDLDADGGPVGGTVLAAAMANLVGPDSSAAGLLALNRARSVAEARAAAALITSPPQNLMVADAEGRIALFLTGRTPVRRGGDGSVPARGWDGSGDWTGFLPFDSLPHAEDPPGGALVNANNRVAPPGGPAFLGRDWPGDWRFRRIQALLADGPPSAERFSAMQRDTVSLLAREALPVLARLPRSTGTLGAAQALLAAWDGDARADLPQPLIWNAFRRRLPALALHQAGLPEGYGNPEFLRFLLQDPAAAWWCGGDCRALAATALSEAVSDLAARHGPDPATWRWGAVHRARFEHPVLRLVPGLSALTTLEAPVGGDNETLERQGMRAPGWSAIHGAGLRFVADLGADPSSPDAARMIIATGQSGHPLSRHWRDWLPRWR
jgi:penicillin amidase